MHPVPKMEMRQGASAKITTELLTAYQQTAFRVFAPGRVFTLRHGGRPAEVGEPLEV
jgi:hypothetical protein